MAAVTRPGRAARSASEPGHRVPIAGMTPVLITGMTPENGTVPAVRRLGTVRCRGVAPDQWWPLPGRPQGPVIANT